MSITDKAMLKRLATTINLILDNGIPDVCNKCPVLCANCRQYIGHVVIKPPDLGFPTCTQCCTEYVGSKVMCPVIGWHVVTGHTPQCTKTKLYKKLLELI